MFTVRRNFPYYFTAGWAGWSWVLQNGRSMIYPWWRISKDCMPAQPFCSCKFIAVSGKLIDSTDIFVSSKKDLSYTSVYDTYTIDHFPVWHDIHLLWKPIAQLVVRYLKGHNATLRTGFESKANGRFAITAWTHSIQRATTSTGG